MRKHLIIAALAAGALTVTGCKSYDTDAREGNTGRSDVERRNVGASSEKGEEGLEGERGYDGVDNESGTGGSGAEGGSGANDVSNDDKELNRGEDLEDRDTVRQSRRSPMEKDMPPTDGKLQILLK